MFRKLVKLSVFSVIVIPVLFGSTVVAQDFEPAHKLVIHVDSNDPVTQKIALNNAINLQKHYGLDNIAIEVVAHGPGLSLMTQGGKEAQRVTSLATQDITFSACGNTIKAIVRKTGKEPVLLEGVRVVPAGVVRIIELQEAGWSYVKP